MMAHTGIDFRRSWLGVLTCALLALPASACSDVASGPVEPQRPEERVKAPGQPAEPAERLPDPGGDPVEAVEEELGETCGHDAPTAEGSIADEIVDRPEARMGFAVKFDDELSPYWVTSVFVMPGHEARLEAVLLSGDERFVAFAEAGELTRLEPTVWTYRAPEQPGIYALSLCDVHANQTLFLNVFVLEPYDGQDVFHGYRIGKYERLPLRNDPAYAMPRGLVRVTERNQDTWVSPHFQLRQFLCKQKSGYPKFLVLRTRLLTKLEMLIEELREQGVEVDGLYVMSGYRTPWYNRAIGNTTRFSRHAYGDAADVFVDNDRNGWMDDLTGDGKATRADARVMSSAIEKMAGDAWYAPFSGGLGLYGRKPHRGPFIHVDTRGRRARW